MISDRVVDIKGLYLEEVKSLRMVTDIGEKLVSVDSVSEDGSQLSSLMPEGASQILSITGVTCDGPQLLAYAEENFSIASIPSGPTCDCVDCTETNILSLNVDFLTLTADPNNSAQIVGTAKNCPVDNCYMLFNSSTGTLIKQKVNIVAESEEGIQDIVSMPMKS